MRDREGAERILAALLSAASDPGSFERLARLLLSHLSECPDPEMALGNFDRWLAQLGYSLSVQRLLVDDEFLLRNLLQVFATSQYFADILCRDPSYYEFLDLQGLRSARTPAEIGADVARAVAPFRTYEGRLDALRRAKRREILRIGMRDIVGLAPFAEVVADLSAFADACVRQAYRIARGETERRAGSLEGLEFAVIAMGKLGGRELNYSSDIDLMFVTRGTGDHIASSHRIGERIIQALSRATAEGYVFRVDMRLRPEGQVGPLVRSLDSYRDYYDHYMENWERQALLKARFVAGDESLGADFQALIEPYSYRCEVPLRLVEELCLNKLRIEKRVEAAGERYTNVKDGYGGIRDIEFTVQLLQLLFGKENAGLRTGNTVEALGALKTAGLLPAEEYRTLRESYEFMRTVEHRLQIVDERAVRCLPASPAALQRLARRLPYVWRRDPREEFVAEHRRHADRIRSFHRRLFFDPFHGGAALLGGDSPDALSGLGELILALDSEEAQRRIRQYLVARGFSMPDRALADLERLAGLGGGGSDTARPDRLALLARVGPHLLDSADSSPDPDAALAFAAELVLAGDQEGLLAMLGESPFPREIVCRLGGTAPAVARSLQREPALLDMLFEPDVVGTPSDAAGLRERLASRLEGQREHEGRLNVLRRFKRRELLRVTAADVLGALDGDGVAEQLTLLAEACVQAALDQCVAEMQARGDLEGEPEFAIFGLGKVGGREMLYASDLDLVLVCDLPEGEERQRRYLSYSRLAELFHEAMTRLMPDGDLYPIDLRLRPEGKGGEMVPSLAACRRYYAGRAQTWERQAMLKARFLAGDAWVAGEFNGIVAPFAYPPDPSLELAEEVRAMKLRVENERTDPDSRSRDLKLGPGGLSDVEFLAQLMQLCHGHARTALRETNTLAALGALEKEGLLPSDEAESLREGYRFQTRLRNLMYLRAGRPMSILPDGDEDQRALARALDLDNAGDLLDALYWHRERIRAIFEVRF